MSSSEDVKSRAERGWMKDLCLNMQAKSQAASGPAYYTALLTTQLSLSNERMLSLVISEKCPQEIGKIYLPLYYPGLHENI